MAAARDEVEEEHQQALERAKQRRAGAHAGALGGSDAFGHPGRSVGCPRIPRRTRPDPHARPLLCGRRRRQLFCSRGAPAAEGVEARGGRGGVGTCCTGSGRSRRSDRKAGRSPRRVASAGAGAVLSLPTARCWRARGALPVQARAGTGAQGADVTSLVGTSCQLFSSHARSIGAPTSTSLPCPPARGVAPLPYLPPSLDALCPP